MHRICRCLINCRLLGRLEVIHKVWCHASITPYLSEFPRFKFQALTDFGLLESFLDPAILRSYTTAAAAGCAHHLTTVGIVLL